MAGNPQNPHVARPGEIAVPTCYTKGAIPGHRKARQPSSFGTVAIAALLIFIIMVSQRFYATTLRCSDPSALSCPPSGSFSSSSSSSAAYPVSFSALKQGLPVHPLLLHPTVAISFYWDAKRLAYLEYLLTEIQAWKSPHVDVCVGTNEPARLRNFMSRSMNRLNATGNVHACPIALPLDKNYMLNWRTREVLGQKFNDTQANYTAFVFLEVCHHHIACSTCPHASPAGRVDDRVLWSALHQKQDAYASSCPI